MKKLALLALILLTFTSITQAGKMIVSVGTFKNKVPRANPVLFKSLVDRITNGVVNTRKFNVVDNARLKEAFDEQKKVDMGMSDAKGAPKSGKIKTAGYVIYGTVLMLGVDSKQGNYSGVTAAKYTATVELNVRFMNVETGELIASKTVKATKSTNAVSSGVAKHKNNKGNVVVMDAIQGAADKVVDKLMELAFPTTVIKVSPTKVYVNLPEERAKKGALLQVFSVGEALVDPDTGESLGDTEELVGELKIIRTSPKFAIASPVAPLKTAQLKKGMIVRPLPQEVLQERASQVNKQEVKRFGRRF